MLIVIDIGNTNITMGVFDEETLVATYRLTTWFKRTSDEYGFMIQNFLNTEGIDVKQVEDVIIASVVPKIMHSFTNSIRRYIDREPIILGPGVKTGISIRTDNPRELGADRIAVAAGAHYKYGGDLLIVDFGTATTFDFIDHTGSFMGGAIAPGLQISAEALSANAAKLPEIEIKPVKKALGQNTITAMQSGIFYGYIGLAENIIEQIKRETNSQLKVIATGGLGKLIYEHSQKIDIYDPTIIFHGLRMIYLKNKNTL